MAADMYLDLYIGKVTAKFTSGTEYSWYTKRRYVTEIYDSLRTTANLYLVEEQPIVTKLEQKILNMPQIITVTYERISEQDRIDFNKPVEPPTTP